jgi:hypothetical protein
MRQVAWVGVATLVCALGCASAQDFKAAQSCVRLGDDAARLSCYDAALGTAKLPAAQQPAVTKPEPAAKLAGFGDNGQLHPDAQADLPKTVTAQVQQATVLAYGLYVLALDNGQVWRTTQADSALEFKTNDKVVLSRRVLGSYEISFAGRNASVNATRIK